jgi:glycosyltransferase involved in cell wall biosynthesis
MRVGIDATCWWNQRGFGRFTRELLKAMLHQPNGHEICLFIDREPVEIMRRSNARIVQVRPSRPVTEAAVAADRRSLRDLWRFTRAVSRESLDLMYFPAVYSWYPVRPGLPSVVTFHDAIAEHFPRLVFPGWKGRLLWSLKTRLARLQARRLMTVSNAARDEIVEHLGEKHDRIDVVTEAADGCFHPIADPGRRAAARKRSGLPANARLLLYVGGLAPHKNLAGLLRGFAQALATADLQDVHLALTGDPEGAGFYSHAEELRALVAAEPRLGGRVHFTGFVSDDDLAALYSDALAVAMPAFSEGFGLPAVEAMACGTPVLGSCCGAVPEVVGEAGIYFEPHDTAQIATAIRRIAGDKALHSALCQKALQRSREFTWSRAAELAWSCLEKAAARG